MISSEQVDKIILDHVKRTGLYLSAVDLVNIGYMMGREDAAKAVLERGPQEYPEKMISEAFAEAALGRKR